LKTTRKFLLIINKSNFICHSQTANLLICQLPDEIILTILTYLNKASIAAFGQTCRRYRAIAYDDILCFIWKIEWLIYRYHPTLWRRVDMSYKRIDSNQLNSLLQRGTVTLKMYQTTVGDFYLFKFTIIW
jgi:hypothetical protein